MTFSAKEIYEYSKDYTYSKPRVEIIVAQLIKYLFKNNSRIRANSLLEAVNIIISFATMLAANAEYNRHYYKWMAACTEDFERQCHMIVRGPIYRPSGREAVVA